MLTSLAVTPLSPWCFPLCPQPPDWALDWAALQHEFPWLGPMRDCPQDPVWHAEGNVLEHTKLVCEALVALDAWRALPPTDRSALFAAALMHDVGKPLATRHDHQGIRSPRHAAKGARLARTLLWEELLPAESLERFQLREQIVGLIRFHALPLHTANLDEARREMVAASQVVRLDRLAILAQADAAGRQAANRQELLERVEWFRELARENHCYTEPRRFASPHTRYVYFQGRELDPDVEVYDDTQLEVIVLSGLPGAGKDHWTTENAVGWPVVSLDAIRKTLGVDPEDNQGAVIAHAKELARTYLRRNVPFVWNATNVTRDLRRQLIGLLSNYHARVRIAYVETAWHELLRRNARRAARVPEAVLRKLAGKLEVPDVTESQQVEYAIG
ncbi:MAG: HDIG domain-containing protein [Planctomycetes bacterium]|nr:HDIG domain-containing protein [Planctomycetota bacterium]